MKRLRLGLFGSPRPPARSSQTYRFNWKVFATTKAQHKRKEDVTGDGKHREATLGKSKKKVVDAPCQVWSSFQCHLAVTPWPSQESKPQQDFSKILVLLVCQSYSGLTILISFARCLKQDSLTVSLHRPGFSSVPGLHWRIDGHLRTDFFHSKLVVAKKGLQAETTKKHLVTCMSWTKCWTGHIFFPPSCHLQDHNKESKTSLLEAIRMRRRIIRTYFREFLNPKRSTDGWLSRASMNCRYWSWPLVAADSSRAAGCRKKNERELNSSEYQPNPCATNPTCLKKELLEGCTLSSPRFSCVWVLLYTGQLYPDRVFCWRPPFCCLPCLSIQRLRLGANCSSSLSLLRPKKVPSFHIDFGRPRHYAWQRLGLGRWDTEPL